MAKYRNSVCMVYYKISKKLSNVECVLNNSAKPIMHNVTCIGMDTIFSMWNEICN